MNRQSDAITVRLGGGLGNQLFQYAAARSLALRNDCSVVLDTGWFDRQSLRTYDLDQFNHCGVRASGKAGLVFPRNRLARRIYLGWHEFNRNILVERAGSFNERFFSAGKGVYLLGYWQSPLYFEEYEANIREELQLRAPATGRNRELLDFIRQNRCVSVHVRRSDYMTNPANTAIFAQCSPVYYENAVACLLDTDPGPFKFIVFSDDMEWARNKLRLPGDVIFADHNSGAAASEDLRLMAACRHNITANSTFSWWGAWLNQHPDKIVVTPQTWFVDGYRFQPTARPKDWLRVENPQPGR